MCMNTTVSQCVVMTVRELLPFSEGSIYRHLTVSGGNAKDWESVCRMCRDGDAHTPAVIQHSVRKTTFNPFVGVKKKKVIVLIQLLVKKKKEICKNLL